MIDARAAVLGEGKISRHLHSDLRCRDQHAHVAPDVQRMAQMKMQNLLPSTSNPGGLTTGILNGVLGNKNGANGSSGGASDTLSVRAAWKALLRRGNRWGCQFAVP